MYEGKSFSGRHNRFVTGLRLTFLPPARQAAPDAQSPHPRCDDIVWNPKHLQIRELEAATLPRVLDDVDVALINTNYALAAGLDPKKDALFIEGADSPYANLVAARPDDVNSAAIQALVAALRSPEAKKFVVDNYHGAVVATF